ncbi:TetR/AcrR family transcriptional regulator [Nocardioides sp.]|uniref:TetR/AcrR family transcriptional regulator n=1 Tax=Nocardioides sp. TaxID=35761 RepID=UPI002734CDD7|nr:TetR/AcrR family transcriptional regulator [Nocardioides sp.]MDP3894303.1 TetR/AcrR family transcriptional regulator [Nocardioides sp.]
MSDLRGAHVRRLRSDAIRSRAALVAAAIHVLAVDPDADLARVAATAGLSRQTLYAHFGSRAGLLAAVVDRIVAEVVRLLDQARLGEGSACDALVRFIGLFDELPAAWIRVAATATTSATTEQMADLHAPVVASLADLVRRGQASGEFDADLPVAWLTDATIALGHAAYELEAQQTVSREQAREALCTSLLRLYGAAD